MKNNLNNRAYKVHFNGGYSALGHMDCGVPQGSCLGHLLFSVFTNDFPFVLKRATVAITIFAAEQTIGQLNNIHQIQANKSFFNTGK